MAVEKERQDAEALDDQEALDLDEAIEESLALEDSLQEKVLQVTFSEYSHTTTSNYFIFPGHPWIKIG